MMSLCKTLPLFIIKQIYHFSLYLVKYPQAPTDLECQVKYLTYKVNELEETLHHLSTHLQKNISEDLYNKLKPINEYVDMKTYTRVTSTIQDQLPILQQDIQSSQNPRM